MDGITGIVLSVIFGLVALVLGILNYTNKKQEREEIKISKQAELETQFTYIKEELTEIKVLVISISNDYKNLEKKVFILEQIRGEKSE